MQKKQRSPSCPSCTLEVALDKVRAVKSVYGRASVDGDALSKAMGYSPRSGPALQMLASLTGYDLLESGDGKGERRVSDLAVQILHYESREELARAARQAALNPPAFKMIAEKFGDHIPHEDGIVSFMCRNRFTENSAKKAAKAFIDSMTFVASLEDNERSASGDESVHTVQASTADGAADATERSAPMLSQQGEFKEIVRGSVSGGNAFRLFGRADFTAEQLQDIMSMLDLQQKITRRQTSDGSSGDASPVASST